jgi:very-short-patch-repair endonuclease
LRDNTIKEWNRYDFCLLSKKIIIEYNGSIWHPRLNRMSREQYDMWRMPWHPTVTAYEKEHKDMEKHKFAIDRGYEILEVWDTDDVDKALQFCFERIMS